MGTISPDFDRSARTAALISAEDEAIAAASNIARMIGSNGENAGEGPGGPFEFLTRSGLYGISVPSEYGGLDASNTVLADVCAILSEASPALAEMVASHFMVIECLRSYGTEAQKTYFFPATLSGLRFARTLPYDMDMEPGRPVLVSNGIGWRINGRSGCTPAAHHAEWLFLSAHRESGQPAALLVPVRAEGAIYVANGSPSDGRWQPDAEQVLFRDLNAEGDGLLQPSFDPRKQDVPQALNLLLQSAIQLGIGRGALRRALGYFPDPQTETQDTSSTAVGAVSVRLTAAEAVIEKAGKAVDAAQIGLADTHRRFAMMTAAAADITAMEAAAEAQDLLAAATGAKPFTHTFTRIPARTMPVLSPDDVDALLQTTGRYRATKNDETDEERP
ncbi:MAG: acyl-CoA dehydrogenase family protein [Shinella sp.]|nr:acyl-CoA dehydrogenase family protein [Shinella sp.]